MFVKLCIKLISVKDILIHIAMHLKIWRSNKREKNEVEDILMLFKNISRGQRMYDSPTACKTTMIFTGVDRESPFARK